MNWGACSRPSESVTASKALMLEPEICLLKHEKHGSHPQSAPESALDFWVNEVVVYRLRKYSKGSRLFCFALFEGEKKAGS